MLWEDNIKVDLQEIKWKGGCKQDLSDSEQDQVAGYCGEFLEYLWTVRGIS